MVETFTSKVHLYKEGESVIKMTVKDYNAEFAARLDNAIAKKLIEMNLAFAQRTIEQKAEMYNSLVNELTKKSVYSMAELRKNFSDIVNADYKNRESENIKKVFEIQSSLDKNLSDFSNNITDLNKTNQVYSLSLKAFDNYKNTSIFVLNKAYPDYEGKIFRVIHSILLGIGLSILTFCLCCVLIYSHHKHSEHFAILFK